MLDRFQRQTVETVREFRGRITLALDDDERTSLTTAFPDERLSKDLAIALQSYYNRQNEKYYGEEDKADL